MLADYFYRNLLAQTTVRMTFAKPRQRMTHLLLYLRRGQQIRIALQVRCSPGHVSAVLNGRTGQDTDLARNIIRLAEHTGITPTKNDDMRLKQRFKLWFQNLLYKCYEKAGGQYRGPVLGADLQKISVELKLDGQIYGGWGDVFACLVGAAVVEQKAIDIKEYRGGFDKTPWGETGIVGTLYVLPPEKFADYIPKSKINEN